jgi:hypothetical protein
MSHKFYCRVQRSYGCNKLKVGLLMLMAIDINDQDKKTARIGGRFIRYLQSEGLFARTR